MLSTGEPRQWILPLPRAPCQSPNWLQIWVPALLRGDMGAALVTESLGQSLSPPVRSAGRKGKAAQGEQGPKHSCSGPEQR